MATKSATLRAILELIKDVGETPGCDLDEAISLSGWTNMVHKEFTLAAAAADVPLGLVNDASLVIIFSHDNPFSVRLESGAKQITSTRIFAFMGDDEAVAAYDTAGPDDILLSGNGTNAASIEAFIIETV
jgi:hypothetical protein